MIEEKFNVKLVELPRKVLRKRSEKVALPLSEEDDYLARKMIYHVKDSQEPNTKFRPAVGVAAVQYGIPKAMFYMRVPDENNKIIVEELLINPVFEAKSDYKLALSTGEGCLSVNEKWPDQEGYIYRASRVLIRGYSYKQKKEILLDLAGYPAIVAGHEMDHLIGKLFVDHVNHNNPMYRPKNSELI